MQKKILLLLFPTAFYAQNKTSEAVYNYYIKIDSVFLSKLDDTRKDDFLGAQRAAENIKPRLVFNDTLAFFVGNDVMDTGENKLYLLTAKALCRCENPIYTDVSSKTNYFNFSFTMNPNKKDYLVTKKLETNWVLHNESKKINNYLCYKATQEITIKNTKGEFKHIATAWYCPEIPYSFGPFGYGGLPGLIFELHDKFTSFGLKSLYLKNGNSKIELPKEGKLIEYEALIGSQSISKE